MPYFTLGYPDIPTSEAVVAAIAVAGADLLEVGVPFSDPLADGPVIQPSTQQALEQGTTLADCIASWPTTRARGPDPLLLMSYVNPILAYGIPRCVADSAAAGVDGFIVPDLPPRRPVMEDACREHDVALVHLLAPTSPPERIALVARRARGFIYLVSVTGVTGARATLPPDLAAFVARARPPRPRRWRSASASARASRRARWPAGRRRHRGLNADQRGRPRRADPAAVAARVRSIPPDRSGGSAHRGLLTGSRFRREASTP